MATRLKDFVSYYDVLEIPAECTKTEIREAWLKLSMLHHPDLNKDNEAAKEKFMEIKEAYTTLINDEKRQAYNNKIGFYHSDPPPDFKREWTFKGEMERSGAAAYHVMWSEEAIRKLMCSQKLRDMNWHKLTPSERYKVLEEEKRIQFKEKAELDRTDTLSLKAGWDRYCLMVVCVAALILLVQLLQRHRGDDLYERKKDLAEEMWSKKDVVTESGKLIHFTSRTDISAYDYDSIWRDPKNPDRYWVKPGYSESLVAPEKPMHLAQEERKFNASSY